MGTRDAAFVMHALFFMVHMRVWGWHTSEQAAGHPGSQGFGWFFRYLTFYSFSLQVLQLALAALSDVTDKVCAGTVYSRHAGTMVPIQTVVPPGAHTKLNP